MLPHMHPRAAYPGVFLGAAGSRRHGVVPLVSCRGVGAAMIHGTVNFAARGCSCSFFIISLTTYLIYQSCLWKVFFFVCLCWLMFSRHLVARCARRFGVAKDMGVLVTWAELQPDTALHIGIHHRGPLSSARVSLPLHATQNTRAAALSKSSGPIWSTRVSPLPTPQTTPAATVGAGWRSLPSPKRCVVHR